MLARGDVNPVLVYKGRQLLLALVLIGAAAPIGLLSVAIAMCLSLLLPAVAFNVRSARELGLASPLALTRARWRIAGLALLQVAIPMSLVVGVGTMLASWQLLSIVAVAALMCFALESLVLVGRARARRYWSALISWRTVAPPRPTADHFARK